jgi:hypothetical protein
MWKLLHCICYTDAEFEMAYFTKRKKSLCMIFIHITLFYADIFSRKALETYIFSINIQGVSGGIVNILECGSMDYSK